MIGTLTGWALVMVGVVMTGMVLPYMGAPLLAIGISATFTVAAMVVFVVLWAKSARRPAGPRYR